MTRVLVLLFICAGLIEACVKKTSSDPVPRLEYKEAHGFAISPSGGDTAVMVIGYEDGDGDLFVDNNTQGPNIIMSTFYYNADSAKFLLDKNVSNTIKQPDNGYYKGKAIKGEVIVPMKEYRSNSSRKKIKFQVFMQDVKGHLSNVVTSPVYTLTF
jgi:hypothetical protein